jgi:hypothetical protein
LNRLPCAASVILSEIMLTPKEPPAASKADDRLRRIESATDASLAHLNVQDLLAALPDRMQGLLRRMWSLLFVIAAGAIAAWKESRARQADHAGIHR